MKKIINRFLIPSLSTFILISNTSSLNAAFVEARPSTEVVINGAYTDVYLHGKTSIKVSEGLFPLEINVTLEPDGARTKLTLKCGEGDPRYIAGTPGVDRPKSFPTFLEGDTNHLLQLLDPELPADKKKTLTIVTAYGGLPLTFTLSFRDLRRTAAPATGITPSLSLIGNGTERFAISSIVPKGGAFVAKGSAGQESPLPSLDFATATKVDIIELFRGLARLLPAALAAFSIDTKTSADGTITTFTTTIKQ